MVVLVAILVAVGKFFQRSAASGRLGEWWNSKPRGQQWAWLVPVVALIALIPVINPPFLTTEPGTNLPIAMFNCALYALVALGLNVVVGQAGLLDLGYVGFFAVGAYVAALFTSPDSHAVADPVPVDAAAGHGRDHVLRRGPRHADAAAAR